MISGVELNTYCDRLEKIGYEIGTRRITEEQRKELKTSYEKGLSKGIAEYEETSKIISERDLDDFINN